MDHTKDTLLELIRGIVTVIIAGRTFTSPTKRKSVRKPNGVLPASVVRQPFPVISSVRCSIRHGLRFPNL